MANKILVEFSSRGADQLKKKVDDLYISQVRLQKGHKAATDALKKLNTETAKNVKVGALSTKTTRIQTGAFATLRSKLLLASFAFSIVSATILKLGKAFGKQEEAENRLEHAIGGSIASLKAYASQLQKTTRFGDEETLGAMTLVAAYTKNEQAIASLTKAAQNLATAKGMDLRTATDMLSKSVFSSTNSMQRYGIAISGAAGSSDRLNSALAAVSTQAGGAATADVDTFNGAIDQMGNAMGDAAEDIGRVLAPAIIAVADSIKFLSENINAREVTAWAISFTVAATAMWSIEKAVVAIKTATLALNKATKKNILFAAGSVIIYNAINAFDLLGDEIEETTDTVNSLNKTLEEGQNLAKGFADIKSITDYGLALAKQKEITDELIAKRTEMAASSEPEVEAIEKLTVATENANQATGEFIIDLNNLPPAVEGVTAVLIEGGSVIEGWSILAPRVTETLSNMGDGFSFVEESADNMNSSLEELPITYSSMIEAYDAQEASLSELIMLEQRKAEIDAAVIALQAQGIVQLSQKEIALNNLHALQGEMQLQDAEQANLDELRHIANELYIKDLITITEHQKRIADIEAKEITNDKKNQKIKDSMIDKNISNVGKLSGALIKNAELAAGVEFGIAVISAIRSGLATRKNLSDAGIPPPAPAIAGALEMAAGIAVAAKIKSQQFQYGGLVGGRRHNQGGTMIEAEQGEFVMSRDAVDSIGINNLETMNAGGGGVNVNISGNVMSADFVENELAEKVQEAVRKGINFGIS